MCFSPDIVIQLKENVSFGRPIRLDWPNLETLEAKESFEKGGLEICWLSP